MFIKCRIPPPSASQLHVMSKQSFERKDQRGLLAVFSGMRSSALCGRTVSATDQYVSRHYMWAWQSQSVRQVPSLPIQG